MIGLVTDSNAMLSERMVREFGVQVVSLQIVIGGVASPEDGNFDTVGFFRRLRSGAPVSTAAPSPGMFAKAYAAAVADGADSIVSIHLGSTFSGTVNAASIAGRAATVPVYVVDSRTASFGVGWCVWAAAESIRRGHDVAAVTATAVAVGERTASVFTVAEVDRAVTGGRLNVGSDVPGIPVVALNSTGTANLGRCTCLTEAVDLMVDHVRPVTGPLRVGVGDADNELAGSLLAEQLQTLDNVDLVVRYTSGPSVAAHAGVGTFGAVFHRI